VSRTLFHALVLLLLGAECAAQFGLHDQALTTLFALLALAVIAIRWAVGPQRAEERACPADCPKCVESASVGGEGR
jgi:hypothetical protein